MSQAIVDPKELRRFAQHLKQYNVELRERTAALHGHMLGLGDTWRDQENHKFVEQFEDTIKAIDRFLEVSELQIPFLLRKAERVEDYLQQR